MQASSQQDENVARVRAAIDAYNRGDLEYVLEALDPEVEVYAAPGLVNSGTYRGIEGFKRWMSQWVEAWKSFRIDVLKIEPTGDHHVLAEVTQRAQGAGSGVEVEMRVAYVFELRGDRTTRFHIFRDWADARDEVERLRRELERDS